MSDLKAALAPGANRFRRALGHPAEVQRRILARIVSQNADTAFGRAHGFENIKGIEDFQARVPPVDHDLLRPWLDRVRHGEAGVLTAEAVQAVEPTSGSTGANKYIPITAGFLHEVQAAVYPWLHDLCVRWPSLPRLAWYTAISPLGRVPAAVPGGPPIGLVDDAAWLGERVARAFGERLVVPGSVAEADVETCRLRTAAHLLAADHLGFISVWSPTFLALLFDAIEAHADGLLQTLPGPRARTLTRLFSRFGGLRPAAVWPHLKVVSCWTEGPSAPFAERLARRLGPIPLQTKGLLATEGAVSVPLGRAEGCVLAVTSHFLEFVEGAGSIRLAHELEVGGHYIPLLTTSGGLYRYRLPDCVEVVGFAEATPRVVFRGRVDGGSDLCGEKLTPARVAAVLSRAAADLQVQPGFSLVAPELGPPPRYVLYIEGLRDPAPIAARVEALLAEGEHYAYCRALGQLGSVEAVPVVDGLRRYEQGALARGQRAGTLKPAVLDTRPGWRAVMEGSCSA